MAPSTPTTTTFVPTFPPTETSANDVDAPILLFPTSPPDPLSPIILDKRQTYVTVSVMKNTTSSTDETASKKSGFPVAIAIPALVGGMALALAGFGIWFWWSRKMKRERRAAWEARQRRKRKRAEQSARPSVSSARANSASTTATTGGPKSPINEKGFVPPVPALPKYAVQQGQDPFKERGYGYNNPAPAPAHAQNMAPVAAAGGGGGAFGYTTQPGFENGGVTYGYDQYGQPIPQFDSSEKYGQDQGQGHGQQPHGYHRRSISNDSSNPSNPFGSSAYPAEKQSVLGLPSVVEPSSEPESELQPESSSPTKEQQMPARTEKSSKRAQARMAVAESAAANASVDPAYRHQPKKPSPLALAAAQKKAAEAQAEARGGMETLTPPGYGNESSGNSSGANRQVSGEWGVALGSPNNDGQFDINRRPSQSHTQYAVRQESGSAPVSGYNDDPYLQQHRGKSGLYSEDPYAAYHGGGGGGGDEERGLYDNEEDDDVYHRAAEGMGLGGRSGNAPKASRWV
ncbi:hypothetical protein IAU59_002674 [Kwoniella sp. CBS 9459]